MKLFYAYLYKVEMTSQLLNHIFFGTGSLYDLKHGGDVSQALTFLVGLEAVMRSNGLHIVDDISPRTNL